MLSKGVIKMLDKAIKWRDRLKKFKTESKYPENVQEHIEILDYLIDCAEIIELELPTKAEVSK